MLQKGVSLLLSDRFHYPRVVTSQSVLKSSDSISAYYYPIVKKYIFLIGFYLTCQKQSTNPKSESRNT